MGASVECRCAALEYGDWPEGIREVPALSLRDSATRAAARHLRGLFFKEKWLASNEWRQRVGKFEARLGG